MEESYDCYITIEPVFNEQWALVNDLAKPYFFKPAKLVMMKGDSIEELSNGDTFITGHSVSYALLRQRMKFLCKLLIKNGIIIHRYKIEKVMMDSRVEDSLRIISDG